MEEKAMLSLQEWIEKVNFLEVVLVLTLIWFLIRQMIRLYVPLRMFVNFVDTMQELPAFIEVTDKRFKVLFEHLDIDPNEVERYGEDGNGNGN